MNELQKRIAAVALGVTLVSLGAYAAHELVSPSPPPVDPIWLAKMERLGQISPLAIEQRKRLMASLKEGAAGEWCGDYESSDGYAGYDLVLAPEGFYFQSHSCLGTRELAYGKVMSVEGSRIRLELVEDVVLYPPDPHEGRQRFRFGAELYSITWGEERFLVPAELMQEFCALAKGTGWNSMKYADYPCKLRQDETWHRSPELQGLPDVPAEFRAYLPE